MVLVGLLLANTGYYSFTFYSYVLQKGVHYPLHEVSQVKGPWQIVMG